jgi:hypothetical protein
MGRRARPKKGTYVIGITGAKGIARAVGGGKAHNRTGEEKQIASSTSANRI